MRWPVSSHRLRNRGLCLSSGSGEPCTLLPFFDAGGRVQRVMVVSAGRSELRFFAPAEVRVRIGLWGPIYLATSFPALRVLEYEDLEALTGLWHYDPWWVLTSRDAPRDARTRLLKPTNTVDRFATKLGQVQRLLYARDLTRVVWLVCKKGESASWRYFRPGFLPERETVEPPPRRASRDYAWQLAPFWKPDPAG
jgi:hypothetical protein